MVLRLQCRGFEEPEKACRAFLRPRKDIIAMQTSAFSQCSPKASASGRIGVQQISLLWPAYRIFEIWPFLGWSPGCLDDAQISLLWPHRILHPQHVGRNDDRFRSEAERSGMHRKPPPEIRHRNNLKNPFLGSHGWPFISLHGGGLQQEL